MMAKKQILKTSEARILVYLANTIREQRYITRMSHKLQIDYDYLRQILGQMENKNWIILERDGSKLTATINTTKAPLEEAKAKLLESDKEQDETTVSYAPCPKGKEAENVSTTTM